MTFSSPFETNTNLSIEFETKFGKNLPILSCCQEILADKGGNHSRKSYEK